MAKLSKQIIEIIENNGFSLSNATEESNEFYVEINQLTPNKEDWIETIWFNGTDKSFIKAINERYSNFDVDEETEKWICIRGKNGVPNSIRKLLEDAEWKKEKLKILFDDLCKVAFDDMKAETGGMILLKDVCDKKLDAVIISKKTTATEIQNIIDEVKVSNSNNYLLDLIEEKLPSDCKVFSLWKENIKTVWYQRGGIDMKKSKQYLEWRDNLRKEKLEIVKRMLQVALFILDLCIQEGVVNDEDLYFYHYL